MKYLKKKKLVLRTLAMPENINVNGDIFGGWIMSQMDIAGSILAKEISKGKVVTLKIENMLFLKRISIGDLVSCYAKCIEIGNTSIKISIETWVKKISFEPLGLNIKSSQGVFIYVAIDNYGNPTPVLKKN
ncbi:acyl-CoA thioester hydrolase YciA [Buchnera aphidicola]|uniref:acyl-CoA thioester hydrolase YciA n=1 Tax=Buchnera aphidicola TaxID=9 RepID=UPI003463AE6B